MTVGFIAFGSYLGPHIAFAGGVAASAYAGKTKKLGSGTDILSCLNGLADPATLLVGGVFGVIGFLIHYVIGAVLHLNTDLPGFTVIISAVIARLVFGSSGLIGKAAPGETREYFTGGKGMLWVSEPQPDLCIRRWWTVGHRRHPLVVIRFSALESQRYPLFLPRLGLPCRQPTTLR